MTRDSTGGEEEEGDNQELDYKVSSTTYNTFVELKVDN